MPKQHLCAIMGHVQTHSYRSLYRPDLNRGLLGNTAQLQGEGIQKTASPSRLGKAAGKNMASALHTGRTSLLSVNL